MTRALSFVILAMATLTIIGCTRTPPPVPSVHYPPLPEPPVQPSPP